jgi:hypothetical protein
MVPTLHPKTGSRKRTLDLQNEGMSAIEVHVQARQRINEILADDRLDDESSDPTKAEVIEALIDEFGWGAVCDRMLDVLRDDHQQVHWRTAADFFWGRSAGTGSQLEFGPGRCVNNAQDA